MRGKCGAVQIVCVGCDSMGCAVPIGANGAAGEEELIDLTRRL
jgi:hypothetical protein